MSDEQYVEDEYEDVGEYGDIPPNPFEGTNDEILYYVRDMILHMRAEAKKASLNMTQRELPFDEET